MDELDQDGDDFEGAHTPSDLEAMKAQDELEKRMANAVATLMEFADTVQISCTKVLPLSGGTISKHRGGGNFYARLGSVNEWYRNNNE